MPRHAWPHESGHVGLCMCNFAQPSFIADFCDIGWNDAFDFNLDEDNIEHITFKTLSRSWESRAKLKKGVQKKC